jgi:hypothetical protein
VAGEPSNRHVLTSPDRCDGLPSFPTYSFFHPVRVRPSSLGAGHSRGRVKDEESPRHARSRPRGDMTEDPVFFNNIKILRRAATGQGDLAEWGFLYARAEHILVRGQEVRRELNTPPQRFDVTVDGGRVQFRLERRLAVFEGKRFMATSPAGVDLWERVD